ncbi:hypothetical protein Efla_005639 [Eimeria flavescens]
MAQVHLESPTGPVASPSQPVRYQQTRLRVPKLGKRRQAGESELLWSASAVGADDRDEFSDDEENENTGGKKYFKRFTRVFTALFPDWHAFWWMLLPYAVLLIIYLIDLGREDSPQEITLFVLELDAETARRASEEVSTSSPDITVILPAHTFWNRGYLLFTLWATTNVALWLGFMIIRVILVILLMNALPEDWQILSVLFTTVDPQLVYLVWSLYTFGLWNATFRQSIYWLDRSQMLGGKEALYYSAIFRNKLLMPRSLLNISFALWVAIILLALRQLLFRALVFRFELGFMKNTNGELVSYLTRYGLLRRFNTRWSVRQTCRASLNPLAQLQWLLILTASLRLVLYCVWFCPCALRHPLSLSSWKADQIRAGKPLPKFEGDPPAHDAYFQFRHYFSHQTDIREHHTHGLPSQLKPSSIEKSTKSTLHNWMLIQYVLHFPPALFLQGKFIELESRLLARTVAENMFASFMAYAKSRDGQAAPGKGVGDTSVPFHAPIPENPSCKQSSTNRQLEGDMLSDRTFPAAPPSESVLPTTKVEKPISSPNTYSGQLAEVDGDKSQEGVTGPSAGSRSSLDWPLKQQEPGVSMLTVSQPPSAFKMEAEQQQPPLQLGSGKIEYASPSSEAAASDSPSLLLTEGGAALTQSVSAMQKLPDAPPSRSFSTQGGRTSMSLACQPIRLSRSLNMHDQLMNNRADSVTSGVAEYEGQQLSRCTSVAQETKDFSSSPAQPHLRASPLLGALDYSVNSRILANLSPADVWCGPTSLNSTPVTIDELRERVKKRREEEAARAEASSRDTEYFDKTFIDQFMKPDEAAEFMRLVDVGGHGKISKSMFVRSVVGVYKSRTAFIKSLQNQASICKTVRQMISVLLWAAAAVALLLVLGVDLNTVLVTGAAALSALLVALSYLYEQFVTAVIFVALTNPYNVGDRVVVRKDRVLFVSCIRTYTTEFSDVYGSLVVISNSMLWGQQLVNESRSRNASFEFPIRVEFRTRLQQLRLLETRIKQVLAVRPLDFVKDSFCIFLADVQPGRWICISIWMTTVESWTNWPKILRLRTEMSMMIHKFIMELGIYYEEPRQPVRLGILS